LQRQQRSSSIDSLTQDIALVKHFRDHISALSDPRILDLLSVASARPVNNADARAILKLGRTGAWFWLDRLNKLSMLDKKTTQLYRTSAYSSDLVYALSLTLRSVLNGRIPKVEDNHEAFLEILRLASDGLEILYERGRIEQDEYDKKRRTLKTFEDAVRGGKNRV
jgi:hypothetical protein